MYVSLKHLENTNKKTQVKKVKTERINGILVNEHMIDSVIVVAVVALAADADGNLLSSFCDKLHNNNNYESQRLRFFSLPSSKLRRLTTTHHFQLIY